jgi:predicted nucleic acid-binding protein
VGLAGWIAGCAGGEDGEDLAGDVALEATGPSPRSAARRSKPTSRAVRTAHAGCRWGRSQRAQRHLRTDRGHPGCRGLAIAALIVDAGPLYAYVDADDAHHAASLELLETHPGPLVVPALVVTEVVYLLASRLGPVPQVRFLGDLAAGAFTVEPVAAADWLRIAELVSRYRDLPLGTVDASVVTTAERLGVAAIATVDRRHFSVVRPAHVDVLTLLP